MRNAPRRRFDAPTVREDRVYPDSTDPQERTETPTGWEAVAITDAFFILILCVSIATWPRMLGFRSSLRPLLDPLQHPWIMQWYKVCLYITS
jgi:hypothetical protein